MMGTLISISSNFLLVENSKFFKRYAIKIFIDISPYFHARQILGPSVKNDYQDDASEDIDNLFVNSLVNGK